MTLPYPKQDQEPLGGQNPNTHVTAAEWNDFLAQVASAQTELADHETRIDALEAGGAGLFELATIVSADDTALLTSAFNTLLKTKASAERDIPSALSVWTNEDLPNDPTFAQGNPYIAGIGLEAFGQYYRDDLTGAWALIGTLERSGTYAVVHDGVRRASYEAYIQNGDEKPWFRLDSSLQGIQFGAGGHVAQAGAATRSGTVLTITTDTEHKLGVGQPLFKQTIGGAAQYGADGAWLSVASVVDADTFTVTVANSGITVNTLPISFSAESADDSEFSRESYGTPIISSLGHAVYRGHNDLTQFIVGDTVKVSIDAGGLLLGDGLMLRSATSLHLAGGGSLIATIGDNKLTVNEGFSFKNFGSTQVASWLNSGGQLQYSQGVFFVDTTSGAVDTFLRNVPADGTLNSIGFEIWNVGTNVLTIKPEAVSSPSVVNTVNNTTSYALAAGWAVKAWCVFGNWWLAKFQLV